MKRAYETVLEEHLLQNRQMLFLMGPRQVGKTTTSLEVTLPGPRKRFYLNWDNQTHRLLIIEGQEAVAKHLELDQLQENPVLVVFDEIHKFHKWKDFLKGFFDIYGGVTKIIVTGSARLDILNFGGDSLMGRYFLYRLHPLSIREVLDPTLSEQEIRFPQSISEENLKTLLSFGGFPEPFLQNNLRFYNRWKKLRFKQLFQEDLQDISNIREIGQLQILTELLRKQAGQLVNFSELAKKIQVSSDTIRRWMETLRALYYSFSLQPWSTNISRSLLKEPKIFLWDWSLVDDRGQRLENFVASHLLKAIHFWTDRGFGDYHLYFLRDKEQREVDFLVTKNNEPWFLVEVKASASGGLSKSLFHFQEQTRARHAFQVVFDLPYVNQDCFAHTKPVIVPATTFLSQLI
jgi:predicted AAA+ superfamily ATPase